MTLPFKAHSSSLLAAGFRESYLCCLEAHKQLWAPPRSVSSACSSTGIAFCSVLQMAMRFVFTQLVRTIGKGKLTQHWQRKADSALAPTVQRCTQQFQIETGELEHSWLGSLCRGEVFSSSAWQLKAGPGLCAARCALQPADTAAGLPATCWGT